MSWNSKLLRDHNCHQTAIMSMSETPSPLGHQLRRPKRSLTKTSDDNILGISWKEERELRKAMYVSLRRQQQQTHAETQSDRLSSLRSKVGSSSASANKQPVSKRPKRSPITASSIPRRCHRNYSSGMLAKIKSHPSEASKTSRLRHNANRGKVTKTVSLSDNTRKLRSMQKEFSLKKISASLVSSPSPGGIVESKTSTLRVLPVRLSAVASKVRSSPPSVSVTDSHDSNSKSPRKRSPKANATPHHSQRSPAKAQNSRKLTFVPRPTLMNASNAVAARSIIRRSITKLTTRRMRSPFKPSANASSSGARRTKSTTKSDIKRKSAVCAGSPEASADGITNSLPNPPGLPNESQEQCKPTADRKSTGRDNSLPVKTRRSPTVVPPELWQDPHGQPVSVHDFVDFICYYGSPCRNPALAWLSRSRSSRRGDNKPCSGDSATRFSNLCCAAQEKCGSPADIKNIPASLPDACTKRSGNNLPSDPPPARSLDTHTAQSVNAHIQSLFQNTNKPVSISMSANFRVAKKVAAPHSPNCPNSRIPDSLGLLDALSDNCTSMIAPSPPSKRRSFGSDRAPVSAVSNPRQSSTSTLRRQKVVNRRT
ncbi:unnamed protein product [Calicophoron daubneyi]|uniref:Uncharacterized protein n=1 Tax=Calicophoron daubneyi TaxID=300641 RepID=A0AAV2TGQ5_CALDB